MKRFALVALFFLTGCFANPNIPAPTNLPAPQATLPPPTAGATVTLAAASAMPPVENATATLPMPTATLGPWPTPQIREIVSGLTRPVALIPDGSGRLFVVEQRGVIRILQDGALLPEPFLAIEARVNDGSNEQGLLGLAFHPQYAQNGWFFVNYTDAAGDTVIARYRVTADPNIADVDSEQMLLNVDQPYPNHNGGDLAFGPDGFLYIGLGDGGSGGDPENRAQNINTLLGKMLRIDVNSDTPPYYLIPADNPFKNSAVSRPEIWAYGLRNPWRFSFDSHTGDLYIGDVGQNAYEEVNFQPATSDGGENYGWRFLEGLHVYSGTAPKTVVMPFAEYAHSDGGCSVTGGYVYHGTALPALEGVYLYGDYCSGNIWGARRDATGVWENKLLLQVNLRIGSFGQDTAGEVYVLGHNTGTVNLLTP